MGHRTLGGNEVFILITQIFLRSLSCVVGFVPYARGNGRERARGRQAAAHPCQARGKGKYRTLAATSPCRRAIREVREGVERGPPRSTRGNGREEVRAATTHLTISII